MSIFDYPSETVTQAEIPNERRFYRKNKQGNWETYIKPWIDNQIEKAENELRLWNLVKSLQ